MMEADGVWRRCDKQFLIRFFRICCVSDTYTHRARFTGLCVVFWTSPVLLQSVQWLQKSIK